MKTILSLVVLFAVIYINGAALLRSGPSTHKGKFRNMFMGELEIKIGSLHTVSIQTITRNKYLTDFPNQCYIESKQKGFPVGESTPIGDCLRVSCQSDYSYVIAT